MKIIPKTEDQIMESLLLKKGTYETRIVSFEEKSEPNGTQVLILVGQIIDENGKSHIPRAYIKSTDDLKVFRAAKAFGLLDKYNLGEIKGEDFMNKAALASVTVSKASDKYPAKNFIEDFFSNKGETAIGASQAATSSLDKFLNDEVPF